MVHIPIGCIQCKPRTRLAPGKESSSTFHSRSDTWKTPGSTRELRPCREAAPTCPRPRRTAWRSRRSLSRRCRRRRRLVRPRQRRLLKAVAGGAGAPRVGEQVVYVEEGDEAAVSTAAYGHNAVACSGYAVENRPPSVGGDGREAAHRPDPVLQMSGQSLT